MADAQADELAAFEPLVGPMPSQPDLASMLNTLRSRFAGWQLGADTQLINGLLGPRPEWMQKEDRLSEVVQRQALLLKGGQIGWGALVQANRLLFSPGEDDCPAMLVYSRDRYFDEHPQELRAIGGAFFSFKNTEQTHPVLKRLANQVTDEMSRTLSDDLPPVFSTRPLRSTTFMVFRRHLPAGVLTSGLLPILTHPSTGAVMIVPAEFWPEDFKARWSGGQV